MTVLHEGLRSLGESKTAYETKYNPKLLERFPNPQTNFPYKIDINAPEFTCLCPKTGQPDFATIKITYSPNLWCVESKSLKLYLFAFRNEGAFHEDVTNRISRDLFAFLQPKWLEVFGGFRPRGGISFQPTVRLEEVKDLLNQDWCK